MSDQLTELASGSVDIPGTPYVFDGRQSELITATESRVRTLRAQGRLSPEVLERIRRYFRIKHIYNSNAIEGNSLSVGETRVIVEEGLTLTGKPLKDQAEARSLSFALDFLEQLASGNRSIAEADVRQIHALVLKGIDDANAGKYRDVPVEISGSAYKPPAPESVRPEMEQFGKWLEGASLPTGQLGSPLVLAAAAHAWFVNVHPFVDGNGRVARLLMNVVLMRFGYPIAVITKDDRARYYDALEASQVSDLSPFIGLLLESVEESLEEYEAAVQEHQEHQEWALAVVGKFTQRQRVVVENEYEVWKSAMDLLKSYFRQTADTLDRGSAGLGNVYFKDFGTLEFEKYASLRQGASTKRTWFFRVDFRSASTTARYLFFFGSPSPALRGQCHVTLHVAREERPYSYDRLETITAPNVPKLLEVGYRPIEEQFLARYRDGSTLLRKVEDIGRQFIEEVVQMHFSRS